MKVKKIPLCDIGSAVQTPIDVFICCGSYEDRCRSIPEALRRESVKVALIAENEDLHAYTGSNTERLHSRFTTTRNVGMRTDSPLQTADNLKSAINDVARQHGQNYFVDITTFTHESLLILLRILSLNLRKEDKITLAYTSAAEYSLGVSDKDKWLTKAVKEIRSVLGYSGDIVPWRKTHLIVLVGYEHERASELIASLTPSILSLGCGRRGTATDQKHQAANEHFHRLVQTSYAVYGQCQKFEFSCSDPWEAKEAILAQAAKFPDCNVVVAPMNTKMSTVGTALATQARQDIQLCYAQALRYNFEQYSRPADTCYFIEVPELISGEG